MEKPIFGVGPGNCPVVAESLGWPRGKSAHSVWMQQAAETGVPGVLPCCAVLRHGRGQAVADRATTPDSTKTGPGRPSRPG